MLFRPSGQLPFRGICRDRCELGRSSGHFRICPEGVHHDKHPRVYPPEFRQQALELIRSVNSANAVAFGFNNSADTHQIGLSKTLSTAVDATV